MSSRNVEPREGHKRPRIQLPPELQIKGGDLMMEEPLHISEHPASVGNSNVQVDIPRADLAKANRNALENCCTIYDPVEDKFKWRSVKKTTVADIGGYGLGLQLYFDFLYSTGVVLFVMAILCSPLLVISYYGDFAGFSASFFAKTTIGNIGICGKYGELCLDATYYPYRYLLSGTTRTLRDITPAFGALAAIAATIFGVFCTYFYYWHRARVAKKHIERHLTPTDYAVEVLHLPRYLATPELHGRYEHHLKMHFEKVVGRAGSVAEVALARDYDGGIRTFLQIHSLDIDIKEAQAQAMRCSSEKEEKRWKKKVEKLEKRKEICEMKVAVAAMKDEKERAVCKAFISFKEHSFQQRVLEAYEWSRKGPLMRLVQSRPLRFQGHPILVSETSEPGNVFQENLDVSDMERLGRKFFTVFASLAILVLALILLVVTQSSVRGDTSIGIGPQEVWIVANATDTSNVCFESCSITFYSDSDCTQSLNDQIDGVLDSSGLYMPSDVPLISETNVNSDLTKSTCALGHVWKSDRCMSILSANKIFDSGMEQLVNLHGDVARGNARRLSEVRTTTTGRIANVDYPFELAVVRVISKGRTNPVPRSATTTGPPVTSGPPPTHDPSLPHSTLPPTTSVCPTGSFKCSSGAGPELNICYTTPQSCDGYSDCPNGDDEENCPSLTCLAMNRLNACPASGKCVDTAAGTCGNECQAIAFASNPTCAAITERVTSATNRGYLAPCNSNAVEYMLTNTYSGDCPGGFYRSPCCVVSRLNASERNSLNCAAESVVVNPDVSFVGSGDSVLTWMQRYCYAKNRSDATGSTTCSDQDIWQLVTLSPNCFASMLHNRRWCDCLADIALLPEATTTRLETCSINPSNYIYFGTQNGLSQKGSFMDAIRMGCQRSDMKQSNIVKDVDKSSPWVSLTFEMPTSATATDFLSDVAQHVPSSSDAFVTTTVGVRNGMAAIRVDIQDRTNGTDVRYWTDTVGSAYASIQAALTTAYPSANLKTYTQGEPHCPADMLQCPVTRRCLESRQLCDGIPDCEIPVAFGLGPDDEYGSCEITEEPTPNDGLCKSTQFKCKSGNQCIPDLYWCDGVTDCTDGSDETNDECKVQISVREAVGVATKSTEPFNLMEYVGFRFKEAVAVKCIALDQPTYSVANEVSVYACDNNIVFRSGFGAVLRSPDLTCIKVQTVSLRSKTTATPAIIANADVVFNVPRQLPYTCTANNGIDPCPSITGKPFSACNFGTCSLPNNGTIAQTSVTQEPTCDLASPISPVVGKRVKEKYYINGSFDEKALLNDLTYRCFCDQQAQYNSVSNSFYIFPPYKTDIAITCDVYYGKVIFDSAIGLVAIVVVTLLNFVLKIIMYWFAEFERAPSLSGQATSEMWKLFLAQFINTALLVLIVNAKFYWANGVAGIGGGEFLDTTKGWFTKVGAGLCLSMIILIGTILLPTMLMQLVMRKLKQRWARKKLTQEAMNKTLEYSDFSLSLRLAQSANIIVVVVMYFSSIPLMLWIGTIYCFIGYWFDKLYLLRFCKVPPQYSDQTVKITLRLMPIAIIMGGGFMVWTFSNQYVFPSDMVSTWLAEKFTERFDEEGLFKYITGRLSADNSDMYNEYMQSRLFDSVRKASFGGLLVLGLVVLYLVCLFLYLLFSQTIGALINVCVYKTNEGSGFTQITRSGRNRMGSSEGVDEMPSYEEAKALMDENRLLCSYKIQANPRYKASYEAITQVKKKNFERAERIKRASLGAEGDMRSSVNYPTLSDSPLTRKSTVKVGPEAGKATSTSPQIIPAEEPVETVAPKGSPIKGGSAKEYSEADLGLRDEQVEIDSAGSPLATKPVIQEVTLEGATGYLSEKGGLRAAYGKGSS